LLARSTKWGEGPNNTQKKKEKKKLNRDKDQRTGLPTLVKFYL